MAALLRILQPDEGPDEAKDSAALALFHIPASEKHRDVVVSAGGVAALAGVLQQRPDGAKGEAATAVTYTALSNAALSLSNISQSEQHRDVVVSAAGLAALVWVL